MFAPITTGKCPKCEKGEIFANTGNIFLMRIPKMHTHCSECGYAFEKEPGYFLGAMYVSYALTVIEMLTLFFLTIWLVPLWAFFMIIFGGLLLFSFFNYRVSRIIWIRLFPY